MSVKPRVGTEKWNALSVKERARSNFPILVFIIWEIGLLKSLGMQNRAR